MFQSDYEDVVNLLNPFLPVDRRPLTEWVRSAHEAALDNDDLTKAKAVLEHGGLSVDRSAFETVEMLKEIGLRHEGRLLHATLTRLSEKGMSG